MAKRKLSDRIVDAQLPYSSIGADHKPTNPKDGLGTNKVPFSVLSGRVVAELAVAMYEGDLKYGRFNYRVAGVRASVYIDAMRRHLADFEEGIDIDPASGMHHVIKLMSSAHVFYDSILSGNWVDDRAPRVHPHDWMEKLNQKVAALNKKYPEGKRAQPYTEKNKHEVR